MPDNKSNAPDRYAPVDFIVRPRYARPYGEFELTHLPFGENKTMCWEVRIVINMQKDTPGNRATLAVPRPTDFKVVGEFPRFCLWKNGCACGLLKDAKGKITGLLSTVEHFLGQPKVKSVDVLWFWLLEEPKAPTTEKIEFGEFSRRADAAELNQDTIFRVFKKWKANQSLNP